MSCWDVLGIKYTEDVKAIKKAYAEKLRQINPDEELKKFQQLKEAFDQALRIATNQGVFFPDEHELLESTEEESQPGQHNSVLSENELFNEVEDFLGSLEFFDDVAGWEQLLANNKAWSIDEYMANSFYIQEMLASHVMYLATPVIQLLFDFFQLDYLEQEYSGNRYSSAEFLSRRFLIKSTPDFDFSFWREIPAEERLKYFELRYQYFITLYKEEKYQMHLQELDEMSQQTQEIFAQDGDFCLLRGLKVIMDVSGNINHNQEMRRVKEALVQAEVLGFGSQELAVFLKAYVEVWEKKKSVNVDAVKVIRAARNLPNAWKNYLVFVLFNRAGMYTEAFGQCKYLSQKQLLMVKREFLKLRMHLGADDRRRFDWIKSELLSEGQRRRPGDAALFQYICLAAVFLLFVYLLSPGNKSFSSYVHEDRKDEILEEILSSQSEEEEDILYGMLHDAGGIVPGSFVYYFLCTNDRDKQENFFSYYSIDAARSLLSERSDDDSIFVGATIEDFAFEEDDTVTDGRCTAIYYLDELIVILKLNEENTIVDILGEGWNEVGSEKMEALATDIKVRPTEVIRYFTKRFLDSYDRDRELDKYSHYMTPTMLVTLEERAKKRTSQRFVSDNWYFSEVGDENYYVSLDYYFKEGDQPLMILQLDKYDRLAHVYMDGWEELSQEKVREIVENRNKEERLYIPSYEHDE